MKRYNIMLIGCGYIGKQHLNEIYYRDNINIYAVVDSDLSKAQETAKRYQSENWGDDYRKFFDKTDIVIIATNTDSHLSILRDALKAGKHVLCEKPIASNIADGKEFYNLAMSAKSKVVVGHILRHNASYQRIAKLISEGAIGELRLIRMVQNHHANDWARYSRLLEDSTPIVDCGVHYFDVMQWFANSKIVKVSGMTTRIEDYDSGFENYGMVNVALENGCIGYYEAGWSRNLPSSNVKEFVGTKGNISLTLQFDRVAAKEEGDLISVYNSETKAYRSINNLSEYKDMYRQLSFLIDLIERNVTDKSHLEYAYSAFICSVVADAAMREGKTYNPLHFAEKEKLSIVS